MPGRPVPCPAMTNRRVFCLPSTNTNRMLLPAQSRLQRNFWRPHVQIYRGQRLFYEWRRLARAGHLASRYRDILSAFPILHTRTAKSNCCGDASMIKILLSAAFILGIVVNATAATKHHGAVHIHPSPFSNGAPSPGVSLSSACPPVPPCRTP